MSENRELKDNSRETENLQNKERPNKIYCEKNDGKDREDSSSEKDSREEKKSAEYFGDDEYEVPADTKKTVIRLIKASSKQKARLITVLFSVVIYTFLSVLAPLYTANIIDLLWTEIKRSYSTGVLFTVTWDKGGRQIFILLVIYTVTWIFYTMQSYIMAGFAENLSRELRTEVSKKLERLPLSYFDRHTAGEILSRTTNDLDKMSEALQTGLLKLFVSVGMVAGSVIMMFKFNAMLTAIFLIFMGISMLLTNVFAKKTLKFAARRQARVGNVTGLVEEAYSGRTIIKAFNREDESLAAIKEATEELAKASAKADFMINSINPAIRFVNRMGQVAIAVTAGKLLIEGALTPGVFQAFFQYVYQSSEPLTEASYMINSMQSALASVERIFDMLDEEEIIPDVKEAAQLKEVRGDITFENVRFGYTKERLLMKDISFHAEAGKKIAVVGSTGAGKTTLINLLMRFYEVNGGRILFDGTDTRQMTRKTLRENLGMVLQDTWLFGGTIAENIAYGKPEASREEIIEAAKAARVDFFVRTLSKGYDTVLNNDAENISAGQKQLLTIARVILRDPSVLILDEATSGVDTRTEIHIVKAMNELMKGRTSFVIAHRLSTILDADLILVMKAGDIVEQGTHSELLQKNGVYAELYNSMYA